MIKQLHLKSWLLLLCIIVGAGTGTAWADEVTILPSDGTAVESSNYSIVKDPVTVSVTSSTLTSDQIRIFKNQTITISSETATITGIVFTCTASGTNKYGPGCFAELDGYSYEGTIGTWTGSSNSVTLTASSNQVRVTQIVVTYTTGDTPTCVTPTFFPAAGTYASAQDVTIGTTTEGATIHYTLDGTDPTANSATYSAAINVKTTTTIKAIATADGYNNSSVATATYTITAPSTIAEVRAQETGSVFTKGVVTSCVGTTGYIQDATAAICVYGTSLIVGDEITVSGTLSSFNGLLEITNPSVSVLSSDNTVDPEVMTIAQVNESTKQGWLVKIEDATVTAIDGSNTTIAQGENTIVVRGISSEVSYAVNDKLTLTGNIGCYNAVQIVNPTDVIVQQSIIPTCATPTFTPEAGTYNEEQNVTISCETTGATIYYTIDGSVPTTSSSVYSSAINVSKTTTIKAMASADGYNNSEVAVATYTINLPYTGDPYVRVTDLETLTDGAKVIIAARYESNAASYFAMTAATTGKPTGVSFTSTSSENGECLPASIVDSESTYYWTVGVTDNGYTFTNANNKDLGYSSSTNFAEGGSNTEWVITRETSGNSAMVSGYEGFYIRNYSTINASTVRGIALNNQNNYGPYATSNNNSSDYNFYLDIFVQGATSVVIPSISADNVNIASDATGGEIAFSVNNGVTGGSISASTQDSWITLGNETTSPISFTCSANMETMARTATVTLTYSYGDESVTKDVTVTQAKYVAPFTPVTYTLATSITPGKHYIIVGTKDDKVQAMGEQKSNNRAAVGDITIESSTATVTSADVYEFMIGGNATDGYTIYDENEKSTGYLYAASSDNNYLRTQTTNDANGLWTITFDESTNAASIVAKGTNTHNVMQYNSGSSLFNCYASTSQSPVYLYEKDGEVVIPAVPTFSQATDTYDKVQNIVITCATEGATIYYTTDGSTPTTESTQYT